MSGVVKHDGNESQEVPDEKVVANVSEGRLISLMSPLLVSKNPLPANPTLTQRICHAGLCPPHGTLGTLITYILAAFTMWGACYSLLGQIALPGSTPINFTVKGGTVFALLVLLLASWVGGWLVEQVKLPGLLGMMVVGILLNNVPGIDVARGLDPSWSAATRSIALAVILCQAGLGLDPQALKKLAAVVFRLAFSPCLVETVAIAITSYLFLGLPWIWGFMLGFVLAAVTPAVVVPCLLSLQEAGWGVEKGIPTLVIAAASVDDVLAISCFSIILGITFNPSANLASVILQGPLEAVVGLVWGLAWGALAIWLPPRPDPSTAMRFLILGGGALLALFGCNLVNLPGSGALAVLVMAFTAGLGWRSQGWGDSNPVSEVLDSLWIVFQPLLFSLIGTEIRISALSPETVGWGLLCLAVSLTFRMATSFIAVLGAGLTMKERIFVALAWLPKATVQAAIGPLALDKSKEALAFKFPGRNCSDLMESGMRMVNDTVLDFDSELENLCNFVKYGENVLTLAVLGILITAPIGAIAIMTTGPLLLSRKKENLEKDDGEKEVFEKGDLEMDEERDHQA